MVAPPAVWVRRLATTARAFASTPGFVRSGVIHRASGAHASVAEDLVERYCLTFSRR